MSTTVQINIDTERSCGELEHIWRYIGYDECNYTYIPEGRELLNKFRNLEELPYYIRTHFIFCTGNCHGTYKFGSTNVYHEDKDGKPIYNYDFLDKIIEAILEAGHKPFVEIGFMPMDLVDDNYLLPRDGKVNSYNQYKEIGWTCPPKSYEKWYDLILNFANHFKSKYGEEEVNTWYYELWNEPDIFYWSGTTAEYCKLFDYTEDALHRVLPMARLAGPAVTGIFEDGHASRFLEYFLSHCKNGVNYFTGKTGTRLDYITFHVKGGGFPFQIDAPKSDPSVDSLIYQVKAGLEIIKRYDYQSCEVVLSEADPDGWAAGGIYDNSNMVFRNTEYYATYVASIYDKIDKISATSKMKIRPLAWAFLFPGERCFEGTRTFSTQGIDKPILNLFKIYGKLGCHKLYFESSGARFSACENYQTTQSNSRIKFNGDSEDNDIDWLAAKNNDGEIQILVYSHTGDRDSQNSRSVQITVSGLKSKQVQIKHYRIDKAHSNAYSEWVRQLKPMYPQGEVYDEIKSKDKLELFDTPKTMHLQDNELLLNFDMPAHAISLFLIKQFQN